MERLDGLLRQASPDASESPSSTKGTQATTFKGVVASPRFDGLSLVKQHRLVYDARAAPLAGRTLHELRIKTKGNR